MLHRFRIRTLLFAVALAAVLLALNDRRVKFEGIAEQHRRDAVRGRPVRILSFRPRVGVPILSPRHEWHDAMADKYSRAARYPWLPAGPDPPEPELLPSGASGEP